MPKLTARQARFVEEYSLDHNAARAARSAGYAEASARITGSQLLTNPNVLEALSVREDAVAAELDLTRSRVLQELQEAIGLAKQKNDPAAMISGWREIAKMCGFYRPENVRVELSDESRALKARYEAMSDDELLAIANSTSI